MATIPRIAQDRGGPSKGAIHNKTGDDYKGLIKAWAEHTGGVTRKVRQTSERNPYAALIDKIENPVLRSMMAGILAENRQMRRQITLLKAEGNRVIDIRPRPPENREVVQILPASTDLYPSEIEALRHAISDRLLNDEGWTSDAEGRERGLGQRPKLSVRPSAAIRLSPLNVGSRLNRAVPNYTKTGGDESTSV